MSPKIAFRTDASVGIGAGHVMRCLTLADELRRRGAVCHFICRGHEGHMERKIADRGHDVSLLPVERDLTTCVGESAYAPWLGGKWERDAEQTAGILAGASWAWLVADHYAIDWRWERALQGSAKRLMAIDDLADRRHEVDLLLDQNLGREAAHYRDLLPARTRRLIGPSYALLRPEFRELRSHSLLRRKDSPPKRILVSLGGMDAENVTGRVLDVLATAGLDSDIQVVVVLGAGAPALEEVVRQANRMPFHCDVRIDVHDMASQMSAADLAVGAAGGSSWERCVLGLPSVMIVLAENQREIAAALDLAGAAISLPGRDFQALGRAVRMLFGDQEVISRISIAASEQCDGMGAGRVADEMLSGFSP